MHTEHTNVSQEGQKSWFGGMPSAMQECIQNCTQCFQVCSHVIDHCLRKGGKHADPQHIKLLSDCAKICHLSADFMIRVSDYHAATCGVCAEICNTCAESCEAIADGDEPMQVCASICRKCADSCEEMSNMQ